QLASGVAFLLLALVAMPIVGAATIHALAELYVGRSTSVGTALRAALAIVLPLLGTQLLASLAMLAGFVLLIVPGIYLVFAFMLLVPVVVVERVYAGRAMGRSRELMRGNFLRGFGLMIVVGLLYSVVAVALGLFALASPLGGAIAQSVAQAIYAAFQSAVMLVFYFDARCRKEAFDLDHLAGVVEARVA
ncbi:MAG: hypothetical protein KDC48_23560, partial [Planctomycetes bacterium]|nr:hypothetical protein [Planctomycetota bacterium]